MADDLEGIAQWRDNIETRVSTLEVTVATQVRVRAQMDRDMSDLKVEFGAQRRLLQALAQTQSEHTATLADHTARLIRLEAGQAKLEAGQAKLEAGQAKLEAGQANLEAGMTTVLTGVQTIIGLLDRELDD
jgi:peptidoglycan hydrolase CwlO-like protein